MEKRKRRIITAVTAFLCSMFFLMAAAAAQESDGPPAPTGPQPAMLVDKVVFEAGDIIPGTLVRHEFVIKNQGSADLELRDVRPSCGCTVADYDKLIAPGAEGKILVKVRVYREWAGQEISKSVWVLTNDPESPQTALTVRGRVLALGTDGDKPPLGGKRE